MNRPHAEFPSPEEGLGFHVRLCSADATATADVCRAYLAPLLAWLATTFPRFEDALQATAAGDALMDYVQHPRRYDPERLDLGAYLRMAARGDLRNARCREQRHQGRRVPFSVVELDEDTGNISGREEDPALAAERREEAERGQALLRSVREQLTEGDRRVLDLMLQGERSTAVHAEALGLTALPVAEQEREVKRAKDRVTKRLQRGGREHG
jgi:RNA polymerase sigma-70 factor (ECF subfamily)